MIVMNVKGKIKGFWKEFKQNWLWVNIGGCIFSTFMLWLLFSLGIINLVIAILLTVFYPFAIFLAYYGRISKHQKIIIKIVLVGFGGWGIGCPIWIFLAYVLIAAPWAPLQVLVLDAVLRGRIHLLLMVSSYVLGAYIMYRVGKKREWRLPSTWSSPPLNNLGGKEKKKYEVANSSHPT